MRRFEIRWAGRCARAYAGRVVVKEPQSSAGKRFALINCRFPSPALIDFINQTNHARARLLAHDGAGEPRLGKYERTDLLGQFAREIRTLAGEFSNGARAVFA